MSIHSKIIAWTDTDTHTHTRARYENIVSTAYMTGYKNNRK